MLNWTLSVEQPPPRSFSEHNVIVASIVLSMGAPGPKEPPTNAEAPGGRVSPPGGHSDAEPIKGALLVAGPNSVSPEVMSMMVILIDSKSISPLFFTENIAVI